MVNIEEVKKYNATLKEYKDKAASVNAAIAYSEKELALKCQELTTELGVTVTPENLQDILNERVEKVNNSLAVGTEILNRIKAEESQANGTTVNAVNTANTANTVPESPGISFANQFNI